MDAAEKKSVWLAFASSAIAGALAGAQGELGEIAEDEEFQNDAVDVASNIATMMTQEYEERFGGSKRGGKPVKRRRQEEEPEEEDED